MGLWRAVGPPMLCFNGSQQGTPLPVTSFPSQAVGSHLCATLRAAASMRILKASVAARSLAFFIAS
jgi:hypothetical protein